MNSFLADLQRIGDDLAGVVGNLFADGASRDFSEAEVLHVMASAARIVRAGEALIVESTAQVCDRSDGRMSADRMTARLGCRSSTELVQRVTRGSKQRAGDIVKSARAVVQPVALVSGELLPPRLPMMREALAATEVGIDGLLAVAGPLFACGAGTAAVLAADEELAATARGEGADAAPPACAEDLRALAQVWAIYLDQDGAEPREARAMRKRGLTLGLCRDGLVPVRGNLLPEVGAQLQRLFDAILNPKLGGGTGASGGTLVQDPGSVVFPDGPFFRELETGTGGVESSAGDDPDGIDPPYAAVADDRTYSQRQHDALATLLTRAAGSGMLPTLGGAAPTLLVSVREEDLAAGSGYAHVGGCEEPLHMATARQIACSGAVQRVVSDSSGRIVSLGSPERIFTHHQRRAIGLRDGGCLIPGCHVSADWCEIHHVQEHSRGGPTHTDNGVLLCWHHHRTLDTSGWQVRVHHGVPEVRGPYWWDPHPRCRPVTKSPVRMRERLSI